MSLWSATHKLMSVLEAFVNIEVHCCVLLLTFSKSHWNMMVLVVLMLQEGRLESYAWSGEHFSSS